jgi:hypothetical protein
VLTSTSFRRWGGFIFGSFFEAIASSSFGRMRVGSLHKEFCSNTEVFFFF